MKNVFQVSVELALLFALGSFQAALSEENTFPGRGSIDSWKRSQVEYKQAHELKKAGQYMPAIDHFKKAIDIYPYDDKYFGSRADCFRKIGEPLNARQDASRAVLLKGEPLYWVMIADIAADQGDFITCKKAGNSALASGKTDIVGLVNDLTPKWNRMAANAGKILPDTKEPLDPSRLGVGLPQPAAAYQPVDIFKDQVPFGPQGYHVRNSRAGAGKMSDNFTPPRSDLRDFVPGGSKYYSH